MYNIKIWLLSIFMLVVIYVCHQFHSVFRLFFIAMVAAYLLNPAVQFFQQKTQNIVYRDEKTKKVYRGFAVTLVLLFVFILIIIGFGYLRGKVVYQLTGLLDDLPQIKAGFQGLVGDIEEELLQLSVPASVLQPLQDFTAQLDGYISRLTITGLSYLAGMTTHLLDVVLTIILLVYFMIDGEKIVAGICKFLLIHRMYRIHQLLQDTNDIIWTYLKTRVLISAGMALTVYIGLSVGMIHYAGIFATLSFLMDFIPYFGSIISGSVIIIFTLITENVDCAIKVGIFVLAVQQIEGNIVFPKVQGDQVKVHPLLILLAILLCNAIWGPLGMLFAVPLAGVGKKFFTLMVLFLITPKGNIREFLEGTSEVDLWTSPEEQTEKEETEVLLEAKNEEDGNGIGVG